jgi:flagellar basal-body rod protein FlgC
MGYEIRSNNNIFDQILAINAGGMGSQSARLKVISENMAHTSATSLDPKVDPYRRKQIFFKDAVDRKTGVKKVTVDRIINDMGPLSVEYNPFHPGADENGNIKKTNVEPLIELMDMQNASITYGANLKSYEVGYDLYLKTINLLT